MKRLVLERVHPLVDCYFGDPGSVNGYGTCGARIEFKPGKPCPSCGKRQLRAPAPHPGPDATIIRDDAVIVDAATNQVVALHDTGETQIASEIAQLLRHVHWNDASGSKTGQARLSGISVAHNNFGYVPPVPLRRRWGCSRCRFDAEFPQAAEAIYEFVYKAERKFREHAPDVYSTTAAAVMAAIPSAWLIRGTPWTSGVINHTASLPYHRDSGNIKGSWSAMLGCRRGIEGGLLHLVDYDIYLAIPHGSISIFDGQSVLHGVTPMKAVEPDAFRFTLVTYAKSGMRQCAPNPAEEAIRAQLAADQAAERRIRK